MSAPDTAQNGWDRWRGEVDTNLRVLRASIEHVDRECSACRGWQSASIKELHARITQLEVRVAWYAGGAAALGSLFGAILNVVMGRL